MICAIGGRSMAHQWSAMAQIDLAPLMDPLRAFNGALTAY